MRLSVIVCTRNRAAQITPCLDSIAAALASAAPVDAEIVVVDNGSTDDTAARVENWALSCAFPVNLVTEPKPGLARARNCALRTAHGDLLVWTDDDCRLDINYIRDALRHDDADTEPVLRGGRVELGDPTDLPISIKTDLMPMRWSKNLNSARQGSLRSCITGCNLAMRRSTIERIGPFDWRFSTKGIPAAEDTDYVFRAYLAGVTIEYVPDMRVYHFHGRKSGPDGKRIMRNYMIGLGANYAKHFFHNPDLCRPAYWDLRLAIREAIEGKNNFMPDIDFSYRDFVAYNLLGASRFFTNLIFGKSA